MKIIYRYLISAFVVILLILPVILPLFHKDFFNLHDYTHVARLYEMNKAIIDGHFPVYWVKDLGWGYGMPLFNFYAPLPYYLAEIFHLIGFPFLNSIKICFGLTVFISFIGIYLWAKTFWGKLGGLMAGIALVYAPYRAVDFYVRGALGELLGISLIPWVLWGITNLINYQIRQPVDKSSNKQINRFIGYLAILLALFLLSHTVLDLIGIPLFLVYTGFYILIKRINWRQILQILLSFSLGIMLASFFLLPAFWEKNLVQINKLTSGYSNYAHHFLYFRQFLGGVWGYGGSVDGIEDGISFHLGKGHLMLAGLTGLLAVVVSRKKNYQRLIMIIFLSCQILFLAFMSTYHAKPIWDAIPLMAFIQFPWRFNSIIIVLLAFITGGIVYYLRQYNSKLAIGVLLFSIGLIIKINVSYFQPQRYVNPQDYYYTDEEKIKINMSGVIPDFIPIWVKQEPQEIAKKDYLIRDGNPEIQVLVSKTQSLILKTSSNNPFKIQLNRFYFPGWQVYLNNQKTNFSYQDNNGIILLDVPSGNNIVALKLQPTFIKILSILISLTSLLVLGGLFVKNKKII